MTEIISIIVAIVVCFIAYKMLMGAIRIAVIIGIIAVLGSLFASGSFG